MKYTVEDGEIMIHQRDTDAWWPLSLAEAQHVVDVMNYLTDVPGIGRPLLDAMKQNGDNQSATLASLVADVQNSFPLKGPDQ